MILIYEVSRLDKKIINWDIFTGVIVGLYLAAIVFILLFNKLDSPSDVFITSSLSLLGTLIGGYIAYKIANNQIIIQQNLQNEKDIKLQETIALRLVNELEKNTDNIKQINNVLVKIKPQVKEISENISKGDNEYLEAIIILLDLIEADNVLMIRHELIDLKFVEIHYTIDVLNKINKLGNRIKELSTKEYIEKYLVALSSYTEDYLNKVNKINKLKSN